MGGLIDTNILLYAANADVPEHGKARSFLNAARRAAGRWYLTEGILYEFLRVATHPRVFAKPLEARQAMAFLQPVWSAPSFSLLTAGAEHARLLSEELERLSHPAGNLFFDIRTVVLMREHGIRTVYTADHDFRQFADIEVVNPLA